MTICRSKFLVAALLAALSSTPSVGQSDSNLRIMVPREMYESTCLAEPATAASKQYCDLLILGFLDGASAEAAVNEEHPLWCVPDQSRRETLDQIESSIRSAHARSNEPREAAIDLFAAITITFPCSPKKPG